MAIHSNQDSSKQDIYTGLGIAAGAGAVGLAYGLDQNDPNANKLQSEKRKLEAAQKKQERKDFMDNANANRKKRLQGERDAKRQVRNEARQARREAPIIPFKQDRINQILAIDDIIHSEMYDIDLKAGKDVGHYHKQAEEIWNKMSDDKKLTYDRIFNQVEDGTAFDNAFASPLKQRMNQFKENVGDMAKKVAHVAKKL